MPPVKRSPRRVCVVGQFCGPIVSYQMRVVLLWPFEEDTRALRGVGQLPLSGWKCFLPHLPPTLLEMLKLYLSLFLFFVFLFFGKSCIGIADWLGCVLFSRIWVDVKWVFYCFHSVKQALKCCFLCRIGRVSTKHTIDYGWASGNYRQTLPESFGLDVRKVLMFYYWVCVWFKVKKKKKATKAGRLNNRVQLFFQKTGSDPVKRKSALIEPK